MTDPLDFTVCRSDRTAVVPVFNAKYSPDNDLARYCLQAPAVITNEVHACHATMFRYCVIEQWRPAANDVLQTMTVGLASNPEAATAAAALWPRLAPQLDPGPASMIQSHPELFGPDLQSAVQSDGSVTLNAAAASIGPVPAGRIGG